MRKLWDKEVFTTGEVARICHVTIRTVIKWFESGALPGYKIPGSRDRRIPRESLVAFLRAHGMPLRGFRGRPCLLIADDDEALVGTLADAFRDLGVLDVEVARNGYEAGLRTMALRPDVLLLDYHLGDVDGLTVTRLVRRHPELERTRILLMSGHLTAADADRVRAAGADAFLLKPFTFAEVKDRVLQAVGLG